MFLTKILDKHKEKYNNLKIENNFDLLKREYKLKAVESYYSLKHLMDDELRDELLEKAYKLREELDQTDRESEEHYDHACRLEYWFELTDELKKVHIFPSK